MQYDVIQVEDESDIRDFFERDANKQGLTYFGVASLQALEDTLKESSAQVYVVDGKFPRVEGGMAGQNAYEAIASIRLRYSDAQIILYSAQENGEEIARENKVLFMSKRVYIAKDLVPKIKEMLE